MYYIVLACEHTEGHERRDIDHSCHTGIVTQVTFRLYIIVVGVRQCIRDYVPLARHVGWRPRTLLNAGL